jgi:RNA polymerase-binding transcription factor DksA
MADHGSEVFEQAKNVALSESLRITLDSVNRALQKMDLGTYRVCDRCGGPIDPARLKALPYATLCKPCQELMERTPRSR